MSVQLKLRTCTDIKYQIIIHCTAAQHAGLSYKGFNLIKVYFSVQYCACVFFHNLYRETLPVAPTVRFTVSGCNDVANMFTASHFSMSARERYSRLSVKWSPTGGSKQLKILSNHL